MTRKRLPFPPRCSACTAGDGEARGRDGTNVNDPGGPRMGPQFPPGDRHPVGTSESGPRNRFGSVIFWLVLLGALFALIPATRPLGGLLCFGAIVPAVLAYRRTRKGRATNTGRALTALVAAPVFFIVAVALSPSTPPESSTGLNEAAHGSTPVTSPPPPVFAAAAPSIAPPSTTSPPSTLSAARPNSVVDRPAPATIAAPRVDATKRPAPTLRHTTGAPAPKPAASSSCNESTHYINSKGNCVLRPMPAASAPSGASAKCKDGTYSFSQSRSGTCSKHGGVAQWL